MTPIKMPSPICRICFKKGCGILELKDPSYYLQKLTSCIPEIDVFLLANAGLCMACALMLDTGYELREICLKNDKKLRKSDNTQSKHPQEKASSIKQLETTDSKDQYYCNLCKEEFPSCSEKIMHKAKFHNDLKYQKLRTYLPSLEGKDFTSTSESSLVITEIEQMDTNCGVGDEGEKHSQNNIRVELESKDLYHHLTRYLCDICKKSFELEDELKDHKLIHSAICCGESYPTFSLLQMHTYKEHSKTCGICDEEYFTFSALFRHLREHLKGDWVKCKICYKQFKNDSDLSRHVCKCYRCRHCKTGFYARKKFEAHVETHKIEGSKPLTGNKHSCDICGKMCKSRAGNRSHMLYAHKIRTSGNYNPVLSGPRKLYRCRSCPTEYQLPVHLKVHMARVHLRKKIGLPAVDCRLDPFYREQEGLKIDFKIYPEVV